ncbi:MAG: hypothetical protein GX752_07790, partial [Clostridium sp.]|nr:hypothetical protein [Clostridium sp.]
TVRKEWYPSSAELINNVSAWLDDNDHIVLKASNSIGFDKVVKYLK